MDTPRLPISAPSTWTDIQGLSSLAAAARQDGKAALPTVARQFEAVFAQMLIKSMRSASFGGGILDSPQSKQWMDMFDNQIALSMANDGKGLGIAAMLVRQLGGKTNGSAGTGADPTALTPQLRAARTLASAAVSGGVTTTGDGTADTTTAPNTSASDGILDRAIDFAKSTGNTAWQAAQKWIFSGPEDFVQKLAPYAQAVADKLGVSVRAILAQAALETGWGRHMPREADGSSSFNMFGIKAGDGWRGKRVNVPTLEFKDGVTVRSNASFRAYAGPARSFADYARLLANNPRYAGALGQGDNVSGFAHALRRAGYATDPSYAAKLTAIANSGTMREALASLKNPSDMPTVGL